MRVSINDSIIFVHNMSNRDNKNLLNNNIVHGKIYAIKYLKIKIYLFNYS